MVNFVSILLFEFKSVCRRILDLEEEVLLLRQKVASTTPQGAEISDRSANSALAVSSSPRLSQIEIDSSVNPIINTDSTDTISTAKSSTDLNGGLSIEVVATPLPRTLKGFELQSNFIKDLFNL